MNTTSVRTQHTCPDCARRVALYADGTFYRHLRNGRECPGSHKDAE